MDIKKDLVDSALNSMFQVFYKKAKLFHNWTEEDILEYAGDTMECCLVKLAKAYLVEVYGMDYGGPSHESKMEEQENP